MTKDTVRDLHSGHQVEQDPPDHTGEDPLWTRQDAAQQRKHNDLTPTALWFAQREMTVLCGWTGVVATHQVGTAEREVQEALVN